MEVGNYLKLVTAAHKERGGIEGQRDVLKTTTAKRIRERMLEDIRRGTVLPPVVLGAVVDEARFGSFPLSELSTPEELLPNGAIDSLAIIDGMQRTGALLAAAEGATGVLERKIRVEFWLTRSVRALVYRMLVLNAGQVPWTLARQLSVVYAPLIAEIKANVPELEKIFGPDKAGRRVGPAQFAGDDIVELYLAFSLRKTSVDTKEALSEEFSRLDFVENLSRASFQEQFYASVGLLSDFDRCFSRFSPSEDHKEKYSRGKQIFDGQPARIGFITAVAQNVLGRPGADRVEEDAAARMKKLQTQAKGLVARIEAMTDASIGEFLALDILRERLDVRSGQVGRFERGFYFDAFKTLIDDGFDVPDMRPCWRAH